MPEESAPLEDQNTLQNPEVGQPHAEAVEVDDNQPHAEVPAFPAGTFISPDVQPTDTVDQPEQPSAPPVPGSGLVDESMALDQAYASHQDRSKAAENRAVIGQQEAAQEKRLAYEQDYDKAEPPAWNVKARRDDRNRRDALLGQANDAYDKVVAVDHSLAREASHQLGTNELGSPGYYSPEDRAAAYDKRAEALEDWAAILHDHPVSEAFKAAHPDVEITPKSLYNFERDIEKQAAEVTRFERDAQDSTMQVEVRRKNGGFFQDSKDFLDILEVADQAVVDDYLTKLNDLEKATGEHNEAIRNLYEVGKIEPQRNRVALMRAFVDDIRSGRAAEA